MSYMLNKKNRNTYIGGLKKLHSQGVSILLDDVDVFENGGCEKLLRVSEDSSFYMGKYIDDEETGKLKEIRFTKTNHV